MPMLLRKTWEEGNMHLLRNGIVAICLFALALEAQGVRATIVGRVTDDSGAVVPGAKITIQPAGAGDQNATTPVAMKGGGK